MKIIVLYFTIVVSIGFQNVFAQRREAIVSTKEDSNSLSSVDIMQYLGKWKSIDGRYTVEISTSVTKLNGQTFRMDQDTLVMKSIFKVDTAVQDILFLPSQLYFASVNQYQAMTAVWDRVASRFDTYMLVPRGLGFLEFIKSHQIEPKNKLSNYTAEKMMLKKSE